MKFSLEDTNLIACHCLVELTKHFQHPFSDFRSRRRYVLFKIKVSNPLQLLVSSAVMSAKAMKTITPIVYTVFTELQCTFAASCQLGHRMIVRVDQFAEVEWVHMHDQARAHVYLEHRLHRWLHCIISFSHNHSDGFALLQDCSQRKSVVDLHYTL